MFIITHRKAFFFLTGAFVAAAIAAVLIFGLRFGIDFTGGSIIEVTYPDGRPAKVLVEERLESLSIGGFSLRLAGEEQFILRTKELSGAEHDDVIAALAGDNQLVEERFNSIGPAIGQELQTKALIALAVVAVAIVLFIAFAFRRVSKPVSSWRYGLIAIVALLHDILIPVGLIAFLGVWLVYEIDVLFVIALLTILGYSVNDTIVVFDRIRENLRANQENNIKENFEHTVGKSLEQTIPRSINTSLTTLLVLLALFFVGAEATQSFALTLIAGVIAGTYSSIFLASPLLVAWGGKGKTGVEAEPSQSA